MLAQLAPRLIIGGLLTAAAWSPAAHAGEQEAIGVLELRAANPSAKKLVGLYTPALVSATAAARKKARVLGFNEVRQMLDASAQQQLLGCDDDRCVADLAATVNVDRLIVGTIGQHRGKVVIYLSLISPKGHSIDARSSLVADAKLTPDQATTAAVQRLWQPAARKSGDQLLRELRIAPVIDLYVGDKKGRPRHPVAQCVDKAFLDLGLTPVSPTQVARLRRQVDPKAVLAGGALDAVQTDDAQVLLLGVVQAEARHEKPAGGRANWKKMWSTDLDVSLQLIKVDTGEVIAAVQKGTSKTHINKATSRRKAEKEACGAIVPQLTTYLDKRLARGLTVELELRGENVVDDAAALSDVLAGHERYIAGSRVLRVKAGVGTLEVTTRGLDGVGLKLALDDVFAGVGQVTEMSPGRLAITLK